MPEVSELIVRLTPEGAAETQEAVEGAREELETAGDSAEEEAAVITRFADKITGAGLVFAAALSTIAGSIISRMPAFMEAQSAMDILLTELALQFDKSGGALREWSDDVLRVSEDVSEAEGPLQALLTAIHGIQVANAELLARALLPQWAEESLESFLNVEGGMGGLLSSFGRFIADFLFGVDLLRAGIVTGFEVMWDLAVATTKRKLNEIVQSWEDRINRIIRASNKFLGTNFNQVGLPQFRGVRSNAEIIAAGQERLRERTGPAARRRDDLLMQLVGGGGQKTVLVIDGKEIAVSIDDLVGGPGVLNRGRGG